MKTRILRVLVPTIVLITLISLTILTGTLLADKLTKSVLAQYSTVIDNNISEAQTIQQPQTMYVLKSYYGKIAVFFQGEEFPYRELDTSVYALPEHDRLLLEKGITVAGDEELRRIIEDYTG